MNRFFKLTLLVLATWLPALAALAGPNTVQFDPTDYTVNETAGTVTLNVTAHRLGNSSEPISVNYATTSAGGTATAGQDYTAQAGTVNFGPGETFKQITIQILNDFELENAERFFVNLSTPSPGTTINSGSATVTISDDDSGTSTFQFSSSTYSVNEAAGSATVMVVRSGGTQLQATVNYATSNGTAQSGVDYTGGSGTLTFFPGETSKPISVPIIDDGLIEGNETFTVALSSPSFGAAITSPSTTTVTIVDNDGGSTIQFSPTNYTVNEAAGTVTLTVTANRLGDPNTILSVQYSTRDGSATNGQDYSGGSGSITFMPGETQQQIAIPITNDNLLETRKTSSSTWSIQPTRASRPVIRPRR